MLYVKKAHKLCAMENKIFRIEGVIKGEWFEDHVMDYVESHPFKSLRIKENSENMITFAVR